MRKLHVVVIIAALVLPAVAGAQSGDAFLCYRARPTKGAPRFAGAAGVEVADRFGTRDGDLQAPRQVCTPADLDGDGFGGVDTHLLTYQQKNLAPKAVVQTGLSLGSILGSLTVDLVKPVQLGTPAATDASVPPPAPDPAAHHANHYECWQAKTTKGTPGLPKGLTIDAVDAFAGGRIYQLGKLKQVCTPARTVGADVVRAAASFACFSVRAKNQPKPVLPAGLHVVDDVDAHVLDLTRSDTLCLPAQLDDGTCNGDAALCERRYDQVAYATTHNAMSNADEGWIVPNQQHGITRQLEDGIRGLMLDTHYDGGVAHLCHAICQIGKEPLVSGLLKIRRYLDLHPQEVVSIIFEAYISEADTAAAFAAAGLLPMVHAQPVASPWPTLRQLIDAETRLVVFTDERGVLPWHHYVWDYASETPFSFETPAQLSCAPNRGNPSHPLFILNHFLTQTVGRPDLAEQINYNPLFIDRALACETSRSRLPNFVTVDYYDIGDVFPVTAELNGVTP